MTFLSFLHFFSSVVYLYFGIYIFRQNRDGLLNRISSGFMFCFSVWSFSNVFIHHPGSSHSTALLCLKIGAVGWIFIGSFFLWFAMVFTRREKILRKKWFYIVLFGIPLFFFYKQWAGELFSRLTREIYGWVPLVDYTNWKFLFIFYALSSFLIGMYLVFDFMRNAPGMILKKQARLILLTVSIVMFLGFSTDFFFPLLDIRNVPDIADVFILIWALGVFYGMVKYRFLSVTPVTAAENIISTMFDSLILLKPEGIIVMVNEAALKMLEYEESELKGAPVSVLFAQNGKEKQQEEERLTRENIKNEEFFLKTKEGREIPVLFSSSVLNDEYGSPGLIVCVARDITERKRLEIERLRRNKLESIKLLAGGIAYDFNNLLSLIRDNTAAALGEMQPEEAGYFSLAKAQRASVKAVRLTEQFLEFSRGRDLEREKVTLEHIVNRLKEKGLPGKKIRYDISVPAGLAPLYCDYAQLLRVMQIIFHNAADAMPEGGVVSMRAENTVVKGEGELLLKKGKYVKVFINDEGKGIRRENLEKICDPYYSNKSEVTKKGTGLGLTICYSIIKKHGGFISVESRPAEGTTVILYLPVFQDQA